MARSSLTVRNTSLLGGKNPGASREFLKGKTILGQGMGGAEVVVVWRGEFNKYINKTRIQIFTSEITISLLPLSCSINEWKSYDLLGQCDSRRRPYIEFCLRGAADSSFPHL